MKNKHRFCHIGENLFYQPRTFPSDPELIYLGDNVNIASDVEFINHDIVYKLLNDAYNTTEFKPSCGCIKIGNNVMIGTHSLILPDVKIGNNVVVGAGSVVTKDIPDNCVAAGVPCKVIGDFDSFVLKRRELFIDKNKVWEKFDEKHNLVL